MSYADVSFWFDTLPESIVPRAALPGDIDVDVAIVGAGFTGLWTAYYLAKADPKLRIAVLERDVAGFGASGRNGGWCVGELAATLPVVDKAAGRDQAIAMARAMHATVDEVGAVSASEGIDCDFAKGGTIDFATSAAQLDRVRARVDTVRRYGFGPDDYDLLTAANAAAIVRAQGALGAVYSPHAAALHPGRLVRGLAGAVERAGVTIYEQTAVTSIEGRVAATERGRARGSVVVRATEAYTHTIPEQSRALLPIGNHMIVTAPIDAASWDEIGLRRRETFEDSRHVIFYGQRTADDRIAFGGLSIPYRFGSRTDRPPSTSGGRIYERLRSLLVELFPVLARVDVTHRWSGVLGVPRDSFPSVGYDRASGAAWAGGYVGEGVAASNLAGRCLADLITGVDSDLARLPWIGHRSRAWEPEPLRWLEYQLASQTLGLVDRLERRTGRSQKWAERALAFVFR